MTRAFSLLRTSETVIGDRANTKKRREPQTEGYLLRVGDQHAQHAFVLRVGFGRHPRVVGLRHLLPEPITVEADGARPVVKHVHLVVAGTETVGASVGDQAPCPLQSMLG